MAVLVIQLKKVVWWSEGIAEYIANEKDNQAALDTIRDGSTYTLSEVLKPHTMALMLTEFIAGAIWPFDLCLSDIKMM